MPPENTQNCWLDYNPAWKPQSWIRQTSDRCPSNTVLKADSSSQTLSMLTPQNLYFSVNNPYRIYIQLLLLWPIWWLLWLSHQLISWLLLQAAELAQSADPAWTVPQLVNKRCCWKVEDRLKTAEHRAITSYREGTGSYQATTQEVSITSFCTLMRQRSTGSVLHVQCVPAAVLQAYWGESAPHELPATNTTSPLGPKGTQVVTRDPALQDGLPVCMLAHPALHARNFGDKQEGTSLVLHIFIYAATECRL